ncbi:MAG: hypothetical protein J6034_05940 [Bacteroidaceae bacterium]|nr:hypothetical protein [Bacteroidaceae bacterium]
MIEFRQSLKSKEEIDNVDGKTYEEKLDRFNKLIDGDPNEKPEDNYEIEYVAAHRDYKEAVNPKDNTDVAETIISSLRHLDKSERLKTPTNSSRRYNSDGFRDQLYDLIKEKIRNNKKK